MSTFRSLYLRWKALRLPWRKHILVGTDLSGNTFWEFKPTLSSTARPRRIVRSHNRNTHFADVQISPQWHQWLRQTRADPPSVQEQVQDLQRVGQLKVNARLADERWEAKARYIEKPKERTPKTMMGEVEETKKDTAAAVGGELPRTEPEHNKEVRTVVDAPEPDGKGDPWAHARETGANPSGKWQPEAWSPGPKSR